MRGLILVVALLMAFPDYGRGEDAAAPSAGNINPHDDKGNCEICHLASESDLNSWFTFGSTKKKLTKDLNTLCRQCHGVDFGHGVGKSTKLNREKLPMDADGKITCAITCHKMHVKSDDPIVNRYHLRNTQIRLCLSCHEN